jgi:uncharacterized protein YciI
MAGCPPAGAAHGARPLNEDRQRTKEASMFIVLLKFSTNKSWAGQFMQAHNEWIRRGFDSGVFLLVGSLQPNLGGGILAHNTSLADLQSRVKDDPFVAENVVTAEILEITPSRAQEQLKFLLD